MTTTTRATRFAVLLAIVALASTGARAADDWTCFQHDPSRSGYSTSDGPEDGTAVWQFDTGGNVRSPPAIVEGKVYFGCEDGNVYCVDASSGDLIWAYSTGAQIWDSGPAVVDGRLYIGARDKRLYCLDAVGNGDGSTNLLWDTELYGEIHASPVVAEGRVVVGDLDRVLSCVDAADGTILWAFESNNMFRGSAAIRDGKVYVGATDLYCLPLEHPDGEFLMEDHDAIWIHDLPEVTLSSPTLVGDRLFIGCEDDNVYCFDIEDDETTPPTVEWTYLTGGNVRGSPALWESDLLYVGSTDGKIQALESWSGALRWEYQTDAPVNASPCVVDEKVYVPSSANDFKLYCLDADTGALIWADGGAKNFIECSPAAYAGKVYCGAYSDALYCYSDDLAASSTTSSTAEPSVIDFDLYAGLAYAQRPYIMLAGISGTDPGFDTFMGQTHVPLNIDMFTFVALDNLNTPIFSNFLGQFDADGHAQARFDSLIALDPVIAGVQMSFVWLSLSPRDTASVPVTIEFTL